MSREIELGLTVGGTYLTVSGTYYPEEPAEMYDGNMEGYPGCDSEFEIDSIQVNGTDITELVSDDVYNEIIEKIINNIEN
jgi:hypothetical protein